MRCHLGAIADDLHANVADDPASVAYEFERTAKENLAVSAGKFWAIDAEVGADIAKPSSGQQRIHDRMADGIAIAVAIKTAFALPSTVPRNSGLRASSVKRWVSVPMPTRMPEAGVATPSPSASA